MNALIRFFQPVRVKMLRLYIYTFVEGRKVFSHTVFVMKNVHAPQVVLAALHRAADRLGTDTLAWKLIEVP